MSTSPINPGMVSHSVTNATVQRSVSSSAGLSSTASSIASFEASQRESCLSISSWPSRIVNFIRDCFAKLPFIGHFFERAVVPNDQTYCQGMESKFNRFYNTPVLTNEEIAAELTAFSNIQDPLVKARAFELVISAVNSTNDIAKQFYDALSEDVKREFRENIYIANGRNDDNHGIGFGEHIVDTDICGNLAKTAALSLVISRTPVCRTP